MYVLHILKFFYKNIFANAGQYFEILSQYPLSFPLAFSQKLEYTNQ